MEQILDLPVNTERKLNYAGFWVRFGAYFIDGILLAVFQFAVGLAVGDGLLGNVISICAGVIYFALMESSEKQATFGKMALQLRVGDANGNRISPLRATGRYLGKFLSTLLLLIGFLMVAWDPKKQGLHDKLADTYVYEV